DIGGQRRKSYPPDTVYNDRYDSLQRQLQAHYTTLNELEEQLAIHPVGDQPVALITQIKTKQEEIEALEEVLEGGM
ncbi:MAG: hypothetical protein AAF485_10455, partial [Chloroflexota bacterium]